jgi:hypothetical protein
MDYHVGDRFSCPNRGKFTTYTIDKLQTGAVWFTIDRDGNGDGRWSCGQWYVDEMIDEGDLVPMSRIAEKVKLDEELFTL